MKKVFIMAGEPSGDETGAWYIAQERKQELKKEYRKRVMKSLMSEIQYSKHPLESSILGVSALYFSRDRK